MKDCREAEGQREHLAIRGWKPERPPPSASGMTRYVSRRNHVLMAVPDRRHEVLLCWVLATANEPREAYERSIADIVGTPVKSETDSSY